MEMTRIPSWSGEATSDRSAAASKHINNWAHSGVFQLLPLGLRVQEKLERLIDKHMLHLGASKVSLSTFSSEDLWKRSGRLDNGSSELFHIQDRRGAKYLLSPTHEEEITSLVNGIVHSYKDLPLKLYQITRKYRDEPRPRQGLLRTREFLMKDLYTFDASEKEALETYDIVRTAYNGFFDELKIPYLVAKAHSGDIGGETSHEYHFPSAKGEDVILSCSKCDFLINEELARSNEDIRDMLTDGEEQNIIEGGLIDHPATAPSSAETPLSNVEDAYLDRNAISQGLKIWYGVFADRSALVEAVIPQMIKVTNSSGTINHWRETQICTNSVKKMFPNIDLSIERPVDSFRQSCNSENRTSPRYLHRIVDFRMSPQASLRYGEHTQGSNRPERYLPEREDTLQIISTGSPVGIVKIAASDPCPVCSEGSIKETKAIELGHTFYLGTRYSEPLEARFIPSPEQIAGQEVQRTADAFAPKRGSDAPSADIPPNAASALEPQASKGMPMEMGCHGIGISRMIAAVADMLADSKGLNWPRAMAPFEVVVIPKEEHQEQVCLVHDALNLTPPELLLAPGMDKGSKEGLDIVVDDRKQSFVWKLKDADLIGYPVIVLLGKRYGEERNCEVQCRRLGIKEDVHIDHLYGRVRDLLRQL